VLTEVVDSVLTALQRETRGLIDRICVQPGIPEKRGLEIDIPDDVRPISPADLARLVRDIRKGRPAHEHFG
jgi:hypothetical protein